MFPINDTFDAILLGTFLFGLLFTVGSLLLGFGDLGADSDADVGHDFDHGADADGGGFHIFNVSSILAFITWFGGVTYLARNGLGWIIGLAVILGLVFGLGAAWVMSWFLYSFLRNNSPELNPADWDQIGQIGRITGTIRANGIGEIVFEQHGSRHALPARTSDGTPLDRDVEAVIMDIERGVAIVRPWAELVGEDEFS